MTRALGRAVSASVMSACAAGFLLCPTSARAYTCISSDCPVWCETVPYSLTVASTDLGDATTVSEVRRGMDDWTRVSCTSLRTTYGGRSSATAGASDGRSVIGWVHSGWRHDRNAIGVTGPSWNPRSGCIGEADMEMNGVDFTWITGSGRGGDVNAYSIVLHEGGHYYGLGHSSSSSATMYFAYTGGIDSLGPDDQMGICELYPGMGSTDPPPPPPDCTSTGCPSGQMCVGGACVPTPMGAGVCARCASSADCGGTADLCLMYPDGNGYCGRACATSAECGSDACADVGGVGQCVRSVGGSPSCTAPAPAPDAGMPPARDAGVAPRDAGTSAAPGDAAAALPAQDAGSFAPIDQDAAARPPPSRMRSPSLTGTCGCRAQTRGQRPLTLLATLALAALLWARRRRD